MIGKSGRNEIDQVSFCWYRNSISITLNKLLSFNEMLKNIEKIENLSSHHDSSAVGQSALEWWRVRTLLSLGCSRFSLLMDAPRLAPPNCGTRGYIPNITLPRILLGLSRVYWGRIFQTPDFCPLLNDIWEVPKGVYTWKKFQKSSPK